MRPSPSGCSITTSQEPVVMGQCLQPGTGRQRLTQSMQDVGVKHTVAWSALMSSPRTAGTMRALGITVARKLPRAACTLHWPACQVRQWQRLRRQAQLNRAACTVPLVHLRYDSVELVGTDGQALQQMQPDRQATCDTCETALS